MCLLTLLTLLTYWLVPCDIIFYEADDGSADGRFFHGCLYSQQPVHFLRHVYVEPHGVAAGCLFCGRGAFRRWRCPLLWFCDLHGSQILDVFDERADLCCCRTGARGVQYGLAFDHRGGVVDPLVNFGSQGWQLHAG